MRPVDGHEYTHCVALSQRHVPPVRINVTRGTRKQSSGIPVPVHESNRKTFSKGVILRLTSSQTKIKEGGETEWRQIIRENRG